MLSAKPESALAKFPRYGKMVSSNLKQMPPSKASGLKLRTTYDATGSEMGQESLAERARRLRESHKELVTRRRVHPIGKRMQQSSNY